MIPGHSSAPISLVLVYFVVWTKCEYTEVVVEKDLTFQGVKELLEDYVFTHFYAYLLSKARAERPDHQTRIV
jgi:hypothetical protein